ncbi:MAG: glycosyltransferase family 1 protein [Desulfovibrionaceae bacterium]|nr:glycosyltransferase family 1 protein [Desulfovibrionaceae bacterium]
MPPVKSGGTLVLETMARLLRASGREARLVRREGDPGPGETAWADLDLHPGDLWLTPEGWVNALAPGLSAGARCLVYCQNWAYLFSGLPKDVSWRDLDVDFLAVSEPVAMFMDRALGVRPAVLRPGIDLDLFRAPMAKPGPAVRIGYMPRKNRAAAAQIRAVFEARNPKAGVEWTAIQGLDPQGVARELSKCRIFLATGFPEGLSLPPLEAMACGCACVGFAGFGGWDYMRQADPAGYAPNWPLRDTAWGGNGLWSADNDVLDAALNLERVVSWIKGAAAELDMVLENAALTARAYSLAEHEKALLAVWDGLEARA